ncbi:MAG: hypothetical protein WBL31_09270 [Ilumatobacteraceae bacterium]|jgi:hypothetical protein
MRSTRPPLADLERGRIRRFSDWSNTDCPRVAAGVYTIWRGSQFVYVGMSARGLTRQILETSRKLGRTEGLRTRLEAVASGQRTCDEFGVYVDFLVLEQLSADQIERVASGGLRFHALVRDFIVSELTYRFVTTEDGEAAFALERAVRLGAFDCGRPHVNPL